MKTIFIIVLVLVGGFACSGGYIWGVLNTYHKPEPLPSYHIARILKRDTIKGFYKYQAIGDEDIATGPDSLINQFTLITRNEYRVNQYVITYPNDSIK